MVMQFQYWDVAQKGEIHGLLSYRGRVVTFVVVVVVARGGSRGNGFRRSELLFIPDAGS